MTIMSAACANCCMPLLDDRVTICLSSEVAPEIREFERFSTTVANAYVRPLMSGYLHRLRDRSLRDAGSTAPLFLMMSGGGLTTLETAARFPIRLVESGPAGGAILASDIAARMRAAARCSPSTWAAPPPRSACSPTASPSAPANSRSPAPIAT